MRQTTQIQSWQLTDFGIKQLVVVQSVAIPKKIFTIRDLPLQDMSRWELATTLRESGWVPYIGNGRMAVQHLEDSKRVFAIANASHSYLLTLAHSDELLALGVKTVALRQPVAYYNKLLTALGVRAGASVTEPVLALEDDDERE